MPGLPGARRHTDPPPFIPGLDQQSGPKAPAPAAQQNGFNAPDPAAQQSYDGSSSPRKNRDGSSSPKKSKDASSRFPTFSRRKSAENPDAQAEQEAIGKAKKKMEDDYPVVAELVTSSDISDRYTLFNLAHILSHLYNRPQASITISLFYSAYLLHDHSMDPSYILTITAPPGLCLAPDNDNNAVALAQFLDEALAVSPRRGTIKFIPLDLSCLAVGGRTLLGVFVEQVEADRAARELLGVAEQETRGRSRKKSLSSLKGLGLRRSRSRSGRGAPIVDRERGKDKEEGDEEDKEGSGEGADDGSGSGSGNTDRKSKGKSIKSIKSVFFGQGGGSS